MSGILYIVATPIGNLDDITLRAIKILSEVDIILAEDTRVTKKLLNSLHSTNPIPYSKLSSYHQHSSDFRKMEILKLLEGGNNIALVTDAGTPGISDPGEPLIRRAIREQITLVPIPGPAAAMAALSVSGLPTDRFLFYGFLPAKPSARKKSLEGLRKRPETLVFHESPRRLPALLKEAREILGSRQVAVAREITKVFEETWRGSLDEVLEKIGKEEVRGEVTVVMAGNTDEEAIDSQTIRETLQEWQKKTGVSRKEAVERVAEELRVAKREVYREALKMKEGMEKEE